MTVFSKCWSLWKSTFRETTEHRAAIYPFMRKQKGTQLSQSFWFGASAALVHDNPHRHKTCEMVKGKNRLYVAISFDTRLINSPAFPGHVIIYPICQSWSLTTLSSELLTCPEKVYLVNHGKMTGSPDRISDKGKRGTQEQTPGPLLARNELQVLLVLWLGKELFLFFLRPRKKSQI